MKKFDDWVKRPVNYNFLIISIISSILLIFAIIFGIDCILSEIELAELKDAMSYKGEDDSISGYVFMFGIIPYGLSRFSLGVEWLFCVICPAFIGIVSEIFALIAKKVHKKEKITVYRVLMTLCYLNFFIPAIIVIFFCLAEIEWFTVLLLLYNIAELVTLIITMKNTYSKRILN